MGRKRKFSETDFMDMLSDSETSDSNGKQPVARNAANARERARMRVLSKAFTRLKTSLPWVPADTKLSKLDTLRLATSYISHLRQILADEQAMANTGIHPLNLSWPFTCHNKSSNGNQSQLFTSSDAFPHHLHPCPQHNLTDQTLCFSLKNITADNQFYQSSYESQINDFSNYC